MPGRERGAEARLPPACALWAVALLATMSACSRSPERVCNVNEDSSCERLLQAQAQEEEAFADAAAASDGAEASLAGACAQRAARERVERGCFVDDAALCAEACRLHPCGVLNGAGELDAAADCAERCNEEGVTDVELREAIVAAARNPGFCTCAACVEGGKLCDRVWSCP